MPLKTQRTIDYRTTEKEKKQRDDISSADFNFDLEHRAPYGVSIIRVSNIYIKNWEKAFFFKSEVWGEMSLSIKMVKLIFDKKENLWRIQEVIKLIN